MHIYKVGSIVPSSISEYIDTCRAGNLIKLKSDMQVKFTFLLIKMLK